MNVDPTRETIEEVVSLIKNLRKNVVVPKRFYEGHKELFIGFEGKCNLYISDFIEEDKFYVFDSQVELDRSIFLPLNPV